MLSPSFPDLYGVLGLNFSADPSRELIRRAYFRQTGRVHPKRGDFHDSFLRVKHAYDILTDPNRKAEYDERYRLEQIRDAAMSEDGTTAFPRQSSNLTPTPTPTPTSRPRASATTFPDPSQPQQPLDHSSPRPRAATTHPDPIAEAYRRGMPPSVNLQAAQQQQQHVFIRAADRDRFEPHIADFLDLAALEGLRLCHSGWFQRCNIDQCCREVGREGMAPVTLAEAGRAVADALCGWEGLRSGFLSGVVLRARPGLLLPEHTFMRETYRIVAVLGWFGESLRRLRGMVLGIIGGGGGGGGGGEDQEGEGGEESQWELLRREVVVVDGPLVPGALKVHYGMGREMVAVLERLERLAGEMASVDDDDALKREVLLTWMCGEMSNWPRVSDEF